MAGRCGKTSSSIGFGLRPQVQNVPSPTHSKKLIEKEKHHVEDFRQSWQWSPSAARRTRQPLICGHVETIIDTCGRSGFSPIVICRTDEVEFRGALECVRLFLRTLEFYWQEGTPRMPRSRNHGRTAGCWTLHDFAVNEAAFR